MANTKRTKRDKKGKGYETSQTEKHRGPSLPARGIRAGSENILVKPLKVAKHTSKGRNRRHCKISTYNARIDTTRTHGSLGIQWETRRSCTDDLYLSTVGEQVGGLVGLMEQSWVVAGGKDPDKMEVEYGQDGVNKDIDDLGMRMSMLKVKRDDIGREEL
ncbi:hypothetical protein L873DRAFT_1816028 [Choiromyces venosus 120613-1]|uniref:Uncharacterized protein n=1 Tax=Choiromyces venosus 120613-1 TaxID=1336337 RepID=A0A3N4J4X5_9PEZI|nr:hypothetical protein L873DRAFT_1816028 [Choiromyces venosus 120613-1]